MCIFSKLQVVFPLRPTVPSRKIISVKYKCFILKFKVACTGRLELSDDIEQVGGHHSVVKNFFLFLDHGS